MFAIALVIALFFRTAVFANTRVDGSSMNDTLMNNQRILVEKLSYLFSQPKRGDIITFRINEYNNFYDSALGSTFKDLYNKVTFKKEETRYVKRVIGVPGDVIDIKNEQVYVNGEVLQEPYITRPTYEKKYITYPVTVPEGEYFVLGDNRTGSTDSRIIGCIKEELIDGRLFLSYYPFDHVGLVK